MNEQSQRQAKTKAFCQVRSWLETAKIPYKTNVYDIAVVTPAGEILDVTISNGEGTIKGLAVEIKALNSRNIEDSVTEFFKITEAAGYGRPYPLSRDRGKRETYKASPELVALRHHDLRRVGDLPAAMINHYKTTMAMAVGHICRYNTASMKILQVEKPELETYAHMLTLNYVGLYEVQDPVKAENEKRLYAYLIQRFHSLLALLSKKQRSCGTKSTETDVLDWHDPTETLDMKLSYSVMSTARKARALRRVIKDISFDVEVRTLAREQLEKLNDCGK